MKNFITTTILLISSFVYSQGHYSGQSSVSLNIGKSSTGLAYNLNYQQLIGDNFWGVRGDVDYINNTNYVELLKNNSEIKKNVNYTVYGIGIAPFYSLEKFVPHPFYIQLFLGFNYRYEEFSFNKETDIIKEFLPSNESHTYGFYGGVELEIVLFSNLSLVTSAKKYRALQSSIRNWDYFYGGGLKINF